MTRLNESVYGAVNYDQHGCPRVGDWIQTFNKRQFWALSPRPEDIDILDIAHALSHQCRFSGHTSEFYSVAQHSIHVALLCPEEHRLWGLLHDASEAYLVDIPRPFKQLPEFQFYREIEKNVMAAVCKKFGLPLDPPHCVKHADKVLMITEARDFMSPLVGNWRLPEIPLAIPIKAMTSLEAKDVFLHLFGKFTQK